MNGTTTQRVRFYAQALFWVMFAAFAVILVARTLAGTLIHWPMMTWSPLNVESFSTVSFLLLLFARAEGGRGVPLIQAEGSLRETIGSIGLVVLLCFLAFYHSLGAPFLFDDYGHLMLVAHASLHDMLAAFYRPHQDIFFRPLGFLSFFLDFQWARFHPNLWHSWSLIVHSLNCVLVYTLTRQLGFATLPSTLAAAVFALHGTRVEAVCWTDARFDLLATLFVLLGLVSLFEYAEHGGVRWLAAGFLFTALALISKEAAFCLPLLVLVLAGFKDPSSRKRLLRVVPPMFALCVAVFAYRVWIIGGIGGYHTGGHADVLSLNAIRAAKAFLWRLWAVTFFPINWSSGTGTWVQVLMPAFLATLGVIAARSGINKKHLQTALILVIAAGLPVQHLLLIRSDLAGARFLYMPTLGIAIFWAVIANAFLHRKYAAYAIAASVLFFNASCLEWNIGIWKNVAETARSACEAFGQEITSLPGTVEVIGLPTQYRGVYFLRNAFPECVEVNSGVPAKRVVVADTGETDKADVDYKLYWNPESFRFTRSSPR